MCPCLAVLVMMDQAHELLGCVKVNTETRFPSFLSTSEFPRMIYLTYPSTAYSPNYAPQTKQDVWTVCSEDFLQASEAVCIRQVRVFPTTWGGFWHQALDCQRVPWTQT